MTTSIPPVDLLEVLRGGLSGDGPRRHVVIVGPGGARLNAPSGARLNATSLPGPTGYAAHMTKRSPFERARRSAENERVAEIERAWRASVPSDVASAFDAQLRAVKERGPLPPPPNQAPGTQPNPPRPGHEPKPPKAEARPRRGR